MQNTDFNRNLDVVIVGAGFSGLYMVHSMRKRGLKVKSFEKGNGVGGTWYWNRYPGAGSDIESLEYSYSFSEELQQEWKWKERYASQPELEAYLEHVADKFDLNKDIELNVSVDEMVWMQDQAKWKVTLSTGEVISAKFMVMATGLLSSPKKVEFEGSDDFQGELYKTYNWPHEDVSFKGKKLE